jgi:FKBP-type peptidyl-prolyl cis-trans isomerase
MRRTTGLLLCLILAVVACNKSAVTLTPAEQLDSDINLIDEYLAANNINAIRLESGIRYIITENTDGAVATKDNCIKFLYSGYELYDSVAFDYNNTTGLILPLKSLVGGMQIGMKLIPEGAKGTIYMPSIYGYGTDGSPDGAGGYIVNPNACLRFDVELLHLFPYNAEANYCVQ